MYWGGGGRETSFHWGVMDIFWNYKSKIVEVKHPAFKTGTELYTSNQTVLEQRFSLRIKSKSPLET